jgi:hypothetical protein
MLGGPIQEIQIGSTNNRVSSGGSADIVRCAQSIRLAANGTQKIAPPGTLRGPGPVPLAPFHGDFRPNRWFQRVLCAFGAPEGLNLLRNRHASPSPPATSSNPLL